MMNLPIGWLKITSLTIALPRRRLARMELIFRVKRLTSDEVLNRSNQSHG